MSDIGGRRTDDGERVSSQPAFPACQTPSALAPDETDQDAPEGYRADVGDPLSRSPSSEAGGARRDRTDDLMLAKHALSQLSYGPGTSDRSSVNRDQKVFRSPITAHRLPMVGLGGLEPPTSRLSSARSNQLSYKPGSVTSDQFSVIRAAGGGEVRWLIADRRSLPKERETKAARSRQTRPDRPLVFRTDDRLPQSRRTETLPSMRSISRKEVIQPQVPLRLPCYDFTPVADPTVAGCLPDRVSAPSSGKANSHGVTGGVYKARERIHRGVLIRDY
jgi:hypothetical protein